MGKCSKNPAHAKHIDIYGGVFADFNEYLFIAKTEPQF